MNMFSFMLYDKKEEMAGGDYWEFLNSTRENLLRDNIYLSDISKIMKEITNEELKSKMKLKISQLIMENGIDFLGINSSLDIFNNEEMKLFLNHEFDLNITKYLSNEEQIQHYSADILSFITLLKKGNDSEWEYLMISNILNRVKNYPNKSMLVHIIEYNKDYKEIYNRLIKNYDNYLPEPYKNFLKMKQDPNYVYNKSLEFMDEYIDIGIDPRISIAPEIEANNDYGIKIELSDQRGFEGYEVHSDATVPNGIEVFPMYPFNNIKGDIAKFCGLCESMKDLGYYYSEVSGNAAGQINLGLDYLDTKEAILNFYEIYGNCEELLYYICNEEGQLFRQDVYTNSRIKAISEIIGKRVLDEELSRQDVIELFNNRAYGEDKAIKGLQFKKNSVCLRGTNDKDYRLEFRIPNGGCNYKTWIDNIRLFGKMMEVSKQLADMMKKDYLSNEEENLLRLKIDLQDNKLSNEEKLVMLMNLLFKDNNIKQIYYNRYKSTVQKIKETGSTKYINIHGSYEPGFDEVEFFGQYHTRMEPNYDGDGLVVTYDPETETITSNRKK